MCKLELTRFAAARPQLVVVSVRPWNGGARGVAATLEILNGILEDANSPAHGKVHDMPMPNRAVSVELLFTTLVADT